MWSVPPIPVERWNQIPSVAQAAVLALVQRCEQRLPALQQQVDELRPRLNHSSTNPLAPLPVTRPTSNADRRSHRPVARDRVAEIPPKCADCVYFVNAMRTTDSVRINDDEAALDADFGVWLERLAP